MNMKPGPISSDNLMKSLLNAKKVMNKVDSGNYQKGNINPDLLMGEGEDMGDMEEMVMESPQPRQQRPQARQQRPQPRQLQPEMEEAPPTAAIVNESRIMQSRLPDNIKQAMINNPIAVPQISMADTLNMDIVKGARRLMEQEGLLTSPQPQQQQRQAPRPVQRQQYQEQPSQPLQSNLDITALIPIMENIIRKVLDEKLTQILSAQSQQNTTINENLVLKVGNNVFSGKITNVKKAK